MRDLPRDFIPTSGDVLVLTVQHFARHKHSPSSSQSKMPSSPPLRSLPFRGNTLQIYPVPPSVGREDPMTPGPHLCRCYHLEPRRRGRKIEMACFTVAVVQNERLLINPENEILYQRGLINNYYLCSVLCSL